MHDIPSWNWNMLSGGQCIGRHFLPKSLIQSYGRLVIISYHSASSVIIFHTKTYSSHRMGRDFELHNVIFHSLRSYSSAMESNFRVTPESMVERSGASTESVQGSVIIISFVSFQQMAIFSCLSCKETPVSLSCTYNRIVPLIRHLGRLAEQIAQNPRKREKNLLRPRKAEGISFALLGITMEKPRRRPRQERRPNLTIKRGKRFARVWFFRDATVLNLSTAHNESVCRCKDHVRTVYTISILYW